MMGFRILLGLVAILGLTGFGDYVELKNPSVSKTTITLQNQHYLIEYDIKARTPLYVREVLEGNHIKQSRHFNFLQDKRLQYFYRSTNLDYLESGYDKGHLAAAANSTSKEHMKETFILSNVAPQVRKLNSGAWAQLEENIRKMSEIAPVIVYSGVSWEDCSLKKTDFLNGKVAVPDYFWKVVYTKDTTMYWLFKNDESHQNVFKNKISRERLNQKLCYIKF